MGKYYLPESHSRKSLNNIEIFWASVSALSRRFMPSVALPTMREDEAEIVFVNMARQDGSNYGTPYC